MISLATEVTETAQLICIISNSEYFCIAIFYSNQKPNFYQYYSIISIELTDRNIIFSFEIIPREIIKDES